MLKRDFSKAHINLMTTYLCSDSVRGSFKGQDALDLIYLSAMCSSVYDLYGIVMLMWLSHISDLGIPKGYVLKEDSGLTPSGKIDIGKSIESGILFTGGLCWQKEEMTEDTEMNRILKGFGLTFGRKALDNIAIMTAFRRTDLRTKQKQYQFSLDRVSGLLGSYGETHEVGRFFDYKHIDESLQRLNSKYITISQSLAQIRTLSEYDLLNTKLNMRNGLSNYSVVFRSAFDLIDRFKKLLDRGKTSSTSLLTLIPKLRRDGKMASEGQQKRINGEFDLYFAYHNRDILRQGTFNTTNPTAEESEYYTEDDINDLVNFQMTQLESAFIGSSYLRSLAKTFGNTHNAVGGIRFMDVGGKEFGAFGYQISSTLITGEPTNVKEQQILVIECCMPNELLLFEHCGEKGRESEFADLIRIGNLDTNLIEEQESVLLAVGKQKFLVLSDTVGTPSKQIVQRGSYILGDIYLSDGTSYYLSECEKIEETLHRGF